MIGALRFLGKGILYALAGAFFVAYAWALLSIACGGYEACHW